MEFFTFAYNQFPFGVKNFNFSICFNLFIIFTVPSLPAAKNLVAVTSNGTEKKSDTKSIGGNEETTTKVKTKRRSDSVEIEEPVPAKKSLFLNFSTVNRYCQEELTNTQNSAIPSESVSILKDKEKENSEKNTMPSLTRTCMTLPRIKRLNFPRFQGESSIQFISTRIF